jgi:hypothetical protein
VSVTEYPSWVSIVRLLPLTGTVPAKETVPPAGAATDVPEGAPMSMPRCCPAAYGSSPRMNRCKIGPRTGQVQASAGGTMTSATSAPATSNRIRVSLLS